jgi:kynureninase
LHGLDPDTTVLRIAPRNGEDVLRTSDVLDVLADKGDQIALVLLGAVNYLTGEYLDVEKITRAGHDSGAIVGWDLAHAVGNVALRLHDWDVDWAVWCSYKYLHAGPGAVAGAFVHERHLRDESVPKLHGWWGTDPDARFAMAPEQQGTGTAADWQLSCPSVLAMAPVLLSLEIFDEVGMDALRAKSIRLTGYLESMLDQLSDDVAMRIITPSDSRRRGAQLSVRVAGIEAADVVAAMRNEHGVIADSRLPDIVRLAPSPLYSTYHDGWRAAHALVAVLAKAHQPA